MALTTGTTPRPQQARRDNGLEAYFKRLEPLEGGYNLAREDGRPVGRIRVYDDRTDGQTGIHVQFTQGGGYGSKTSVFHFDELASYDELIDALNAAREQLRVAQKGKRRP